VSKRVGKEKALNEKKKEPTRARNAFSPPNSSGQPRVEFYSITFWLSLYVAHRGIRTIQLRLMRQERRKRKTPFKNELPSEIIEEKEKRFYLTFAHRNARVNPCCMRH
jgi:hypothetical protein